MIPSLVKKRLPRYEVTWPGSRIIDMCMNYRLARESARTGNKCYFGAWGGHEPRIEEDSQLVYLSALDMELGRPYAKIVRLF